MAQSASAFHFSIGKLGEEATATSDDEGRSTLANTPTWAVGVVCIIIVIASFCLERCLKSLDQYFDRTQQKPLKDALHRMKEDVMMLGFISLMLVVSRDSLAKICVASFLSEYMMPCEVARGITVVTDSGMVARCKENEMPLMSIESIHQLHMFIFVMAIVHVCYCCVTMILARLQLSGCRHWEDEVRNLVLAESPEVDYQSLFLVDRVHGNPCVSMFRLTWLDSFFRQFWRPVKKSDYLNLRRGFIKVHRTSPKFNFLNYMMRTMEDDFKIIVAIRAHLWMFVIIFMLLNIHGWYTYFWVAFIPFTLLLIVGTKLQHIITSMALEIARSQGETEGSVKPRDELFWFNNPEILLHIIHFILFQNSFELAYFVWIWSTYGLDSCFMKKRGFVYARVSLGFISQLLCSYTTLPLYAIVTQMGSSYKKAIFSAPLTKSLKDWHQRVKNKTNQPEEDSEDFQESYQTADSSIKEGARHQHQQDSSDWSNVSEASKVQPSKDKGKGHTSRIYSSDLSIVSEESTCKDCPGAKELQWPSSLNPASGMESAPEVKTNMQTSSSQPQADGSREFVSVSIDSPKCIQERSTLDQSENDVVK
ncbi:unnamed protein product [Calypogeia fissa]